MCSQGLLWWPYFWAREVERDCMHTRTYFLSSPAITIPDQLWLGGSWAARGETGSLWDSASHGRMPHFASLEFIAWREVHAFFRTFGAQGHCYANLDKKFCCNKEGFHHLVLEQPHVLFPECWMVTVPKQCYQRAWHPSIGTKCWREWYFLGFVLPRLKRAWAALHGWKRHKIQPVHLEIVFAEFWSMLYSFVHKWQNAHVPLKSLEITYNVVPPDASQGKSSLGKYSVNFP